MSITTPGGALGDGEKTPRSLRTRRRDLHEDEAGRSQPHQGYWHESQWRRFIGSTGTWYPPMVSVSLSMMSPELVCGPVWRETVTLRVDEEKAIPAMRSDR